MRSDIECPYCGTELEIDHEDGYGYEDGVKHQQECDSCEKTFIFITSISYDYDVDTADCLNGGEHKYRPTHTYPKMFTKMECIDCGDIRKPTDSERILFQIPYNDL